MNFTCLRDLRVFLLGTLPDATPPPDWTPEAEPCPEDMTGDITVNCFRFAGIFKKNPAALAAAVTEFLRGHDDVETAESVKAFVNITLKAGVLHRAAAADINGLISSVALPETERRRILIEYSAPNTNKPQHLGHVRNNTLGMATAALLARAGHDVVKVNLVNDRGIHICKSMIAYQRFGEGVTPESTGIKGDHLVGDFYVKYNSELNRQLDELRRSRPELADKKDDDLFSETEIGRATQKMLRDWEAGEPEVRELWRTMNGWVFAGFDATYARMGVEFDKTYLESDTYLLGKDIVDKGLADGVFQRRDDGAAVVELDKKLGGEKVVLRSDGTSVYITQDIGTTVMKHDEFGAESQIWVVGDEQKLHFRQLFAILAKLGYKWAGKLHHLAYGMVNLPSGKMKSREGTVVDADDLFDDMVGLALKACQERYGDDPPADIAERAEFIGMGALKFMLLKFNPKTTVMFDPDAAVKFEGDTGPYSQYACARINSIIRKGAERGLDADTGETAWSLLDSAAEKRLSIILARYPAIIRQGAVKLDCSGLAAYTLDLAKAFSRFYRECPVLNAEDQALARARLAMCLAVRGVLSDCLRTLTIEVPEAM